MNSSVPMRGLAALLLLSFAITAAAQEEGGAQSSQPDDSAMSCHQLIDKATALATKMPSGVEKLSAQKEIASAKMDLDKGEMTSCKTHAHNAMRAMTDKTAR